MTKKDLIDEIKFELGLPKADAVKAVDVAIRFMSEALSNGESVKINGFGTFHVREKSARSYRNKSTGELVQTEAGKRIQFKPSGRLLEMIQPDSGSSDAGVDDETDEDAE